MSVRWWVGCILAALSAGHMFFFWLSEHCHRLWLLVMITYGSREDRMEYQKRYSELVRLLDAWGADG